MKTTEVISDQVVRAPVATADPPRGPNRAEIYLVINPGSRGGRAAARARIYRRLLAASGVSCDWDQTNDLDDASALARRALARGYRTIVAVGGDGTINRVINGFCCVAPRSAGAALGVLYAGTSPDFCRFFRIPIEPELAVAHLRKASARPVDICRIRHHGRDGRIRSDYFASSANIGLGAGIAERSNRYRTFVGDFTGTLLAAVKTIAGHRPLQVRMTLDGEPHVLQSCLNITVGKNPHLASGLKLAVDSHPDDGRFFVFALDRMTRRDLLRHLPLLYTGRIARRERFFLRYGRCLRIEPVGRRVPTEFDGDPAGWCPAEITLLPRALPLICGSPGGV